MDILNIQKTKTTPLIMFEKNSGVLEISGRSIPENSSKFYDPILSWIDNYKSNPNPKTILKIFLEYFNTSSSKYLYEIFKRFEALHNREDENSVLVEWYYEKDVDEMSETGQDYADIINVPFKILIYEE